MVRKLAAVLALSAAFVSAGHAAEIPSDAAAFTTYVQQKLQLYSPSPINLVGPLSLSVGPASSAINLPSLKTVHDLCVLAPSKCERAVNDFVQETVRGILQKPPANAAAAEPAVVQTQLVACNRTSRVVQLASVYVPVYDTNWRSTGWIPLDAGTCRGILQTTHPVFYARAEGANRDAMHNPYVKGGMTEGDVTIANAGCDISLCVPHLGDWDDRVDTLENLCKTNREPAKFKTFHEDGRAMQIWNLEQ